jgi:hypothetical protein
VFVPDLTAPRVVSLVESTITDAAFTITATLNETGNAIMYYSLYSNLSNATTIAKTTYVLSHVFTPTSLINNTQYFWLINGSDSNGNIYSTVMYNTTTLQTSSTSTSVLTSCSDSVRDGIDASMALVSLLQVIGTLIGVKIILDIIKDGLMNGFNFNEKDIIKDVIAIGFTVMVLTAINIALQNMCPV